MLPTNTFFMSAEFMEQKKRWIGQHYHVKLAIVIPFKLYINWSWQLTYIFRYLKLNVGFFLKIA